MRVCFALKMDFSFLARAEIFSLRGSGASAQEISDLLVPSSVEIILMLAPPINKKRSDTPSNFTMKSSMA